MCLEKEKIIENIFWKSKLKMCLEKEKIIENIFWNSLKIKVEDVPRKEKIIESIFWKSLYIDHTRKWYLKRLLLFAVVTQLS